MRFYYGTALPAVTNVTEKFSVPGSQFSGKPNILRGCRSQSFGPGDPTICNGGIMGRSYRDLIAWRKAMKFVTEICAVTQRLPSEERYGIAKLRRASVSVASKIAERQARFSEIDFLSQAAGSLAEIGAQLLIARDLKCLPTKADGLFAAADELGRVVNGLIASINASIDASINDRAAQAGHVPSENRELRPYCPNSAGLPVNRSIRFAVGGWVENKLPKLIPPRNGAIMKRCAVDGLAKSGRCLE